MMELKNVSVGYGEKPILENVCLTIVPGTLTAIVGHNGSGKSTLLKSAAGLIPVLGGQVVVDGIPLASLNQRDRAKKIAMVFQKQPDTRMDAHTMVLHGRFPYLSWPRSFSKQDHQLVGEQMKALQIEHLSNRSTGELSGGELQKVCLARALVQESPYLFLDEPSAFLDPASSWQLLKEIKKRCKDENKAALIILHDLDLAAAWADRFVLVQDHGIHQFDDVKTFVASSLVQEAFRATFELKTIDGHPRLISLFSDTE